MPGDGSCLWHSLAAWSVSNVGAAQSTATGLEYKASALRQFGEQSERVAKAWGCSGPAVHSACSEWQTEWADARAVIAAAILEDVTILVLNRKDATLERFSPTLTPPFGSRPPWLLEFTGDHFNPVTPPSQEWLQNLALTVPLHPWVKPMETPKFMVGGAHCPFDPCEATTVSHAQSVFDSTTLNCTTFHAAIAKWAEHGDRQAHENDDQEKMKSESLLLHSTNVGVGKIEDYSSWIASTIAPLIFGVCRRLMPVRNVSEVLRLPLPRQALLWCGEPRPREKPERVGVTFLTEGLCQELLLLRVPLFRSPQLNHEPRKGGPYLMLADLLWPPMLPLRQKGVW